MTTEPARWLGLGTSTTHRQLLAVEPLLDQNPESGRYRLSSTVHELVARVPVSRRRGWSTPTPRQEGIR